jgi:hypothetical protein
MGLKRWLPGLLLAGLVACQSSGTGPEAPELSGSWRWVSATGSIAGVTLTPASESYSVRYQFAGNQLRVFRNDSLIATSLITVSDDEITFQPSVQAFVFGRPSETQRLELLDGDTLVLNDPCCDLFTYHFVLER